MSALTLGLLAALCWGIHDIAIRYLSQSVPLRAALFVVLLVGGGVQSVILLWVSGSLLMPVPVFLLSLGAGVAFLVASLGLYHAFARGPVRVVAPLIAGYPILSILFALMGGATISAFQWAAVFAIVIGVGFVAAMSDPEADGSPPFGPTILLSMLAAVGFACTFKLGHLAAESAGEVPTTLVARLTALICLAGLIYAQKSHPFPGRRALIPLGLMGVLDGVALLSVISAAPLPNPEFAAVASSTFGLLTIVLAWAFLKERMTMAQWGGCLLAFSGVGYLAL